MPPLTVTYVWTPQDYTLHRRPDEKVTLGIHKEPKPMTKDVYCASNVIAYGSCLYGKLSLRVMLLLLHLLLRLHALLLLCESAANGTGLLLTEVERNQCLTLLFVELP